MIIKILLVILILILIGWFLANHATQRVRAWQKLGMIVLMLIGVVVVIFPDTSNKAAHFLGVGRGADLLLYFLTLAFIFTVISIYLKGKEDQRRTVILARKIALLEAQCREKDKY